MAEGSGDKKKRAPRESNPLWRGYVFMALTSLVSFASVANIPKTGRRGEWATCLSFGIVIFSISVLVLLFDRFQCCVDIINYTKACNGRLEGFTLVFCTLIWIAGVGYITQVGGLAYYAMNIYFSSWLSLVACIYTLNQWSTAQDILSIKELTSLSATLKSWHLLFLSSLVVLGTCVDLHRSFPEGKEQDDSSFGIALGMVSGTISLLFLMVHYKFVKCCSEGGWAELSSSFFLILMWVIGVGVLTQDGGIASTIVGYGCRGLLQGDYLLEATGIIIDQCNVTFVAPSVSSAQQQITCLDFLEQQEIPGSNLYLSSWICLCASINITNRWKAAQALQFAQTQQKVDDGPNTSTRSSGVVAGASSPVNETSARSDEDDM